MPKTFLYPKYTYCKGFNTIGRIVSELLTFRHTDTKLSFRGHTSIRQGDPHFTRFGIEFPKSLTKYQVSKSRGLGCVLMSQSFRQSVSQSVDVQFYIYIYRYTIISHTYSLHHIPITKSRFTYLSIIRSVPND